MPLPIERLKTLAHYTVEMMPHEIPDMAQEIIEKREALRWRKFPDNLPKRDGQYLVALSFGGKEEYHIGKVENGNFVYGLGYITRFLPIPEGDK